MAPRTFSIDESRVQRILSAGEAALAAEREFGDAERDVRARLSGLRMRRDHEEANSPKKVGHMMTIGGERQEVVDPGRFDAEITSLENELQRTLQRRAESSVRRQHEMRLGNRVREFVGERSHFTIGAVR